MTPHTIPQTVLFPDLFDKPLVATFNQEHASSDGGAVLLKAAERVYLGQGVRPVSGRQTRTGEDSAHARGPDPSGSSASRAVIPMATMPTTWPTTPSTSCCIGTRCPARPCVATHDPRFENGARRSVLYRMGRELAACVIRTSSASPDRARRITIDLDPTDDLTHGAQQLTLFNGHYGGWCYLPMLGFLSFDREAEQYLCAAVLRPGKAVAADGTLGLLCRLLPLLRACVSAGAVSRPARRGLCDPGDLRFPGCRAPARLRVAMAKNAVLPACGVRHAGGPRAERGRWRDRARLYRHPLRRRHVGPRAPGRDQGRSRSPRRPRAAGQPAVRGDESAADAALHLREGLLCRGDIENRIKELLDRSTARAAV